MKFPYINNFIEVHLGKNRSNIRLHKQSTVFFSGGVFSAMGQIVQKMVCPSPPLNLETAQGAVWKVGVSCKI